MCAEKKILIVDDEEDLTWGISRNLLNSGYNFDVHCAKDGDSAFEKLEKNTYDLVISDFRMPGCNGLELILDVRQRNPETEIILMTAYGSDEIKKKAEERGSFFYIEKPFEMNYLKHLVFEALGVGDLGFDGFLSKIGVRQLIELNCRMKKSSSLLISRKKENGKIFFHNGHVIHAECGQLRGEQAFSNLLKWHSGTFTIKREPLTSQRTISRDWKALIHQYI